MAPLVAVIAQVRFSPILSIGQHQASEAVVKFQDALRATYPHLTLDHTHHIAMAGQNSAPSIGHSQVWRLADSTDLSPQWRVSLAQDFVALEARQYTSRADFLARFQAVLHAVEKCFAPTDSTRFGLRYIARLTGTAERRLTQLVKPEILGLLASNDTMLKPLQPSVVHSMTHINFLAPHDDAVSARWGMLPPNATHEPELIDPISERSWILDLDMFTTRPQPIAEPGLVDVATDFAECLYWLFRQIVTDDFLRHYGGHP